EQYVLRDPPVEEILDVARRGKAADLFAHHRLEVMRYAGHGKDVLQLRRQRRIGIGRVAVVLLRLLDRLRPEERGIVGVLAMDQRYETEVGELLLATIG